MRLDSAPSLPGILTAFVLILSSITSVLGAKTPDNIYGTVCTTAVGTYTFANCSSSSSSGHHKRAKSHGGSSTCYCKNKPYALSIFACIDTYIPTENQNEATSALATSCKWDDETIEKYMDAAKSVTATAPTSTTAKVSTAFVVSEDTYMGVYNNLESRIHSRWTCTTYGASMLGYWGCVLVLKVMTNMVKKFGMSVLKTFDFPLIRRIRRHVLLAPTFNYRHSTPIYLGKWTLQVPSRQQSLIVLGSIVLCLIFTFVDHHVRTPNTWTVPQMWTSFIGQRSGMISMYLFPLMILFGGRNNFLLWLTGWPLDTFNVFHKWIGRIIVVELFVHTVTFSVNYDILGRYPTTLAANFMTWGVVGFICGCFILLQGNHYFRSLSYEIFLVLHILLAIFFMVGSWYHFAHFHQGYEMLYAGIAVWGVDRIARWIRMAWSGGAIPGTVRYYPNSEVFVIDVQYSKWWKFYPGCYSFVHILKGAYFWQSHPFTLTEHPNKPGELRIFAKVKKGMTRRVADAALKAPGNEMKVRLGFEGPYGPHAPVHHYDTAVLIAGGIGVSATYAYAADSIKRDSKQRVIFIWVVSSEASLEWFQEELAHMAKHPRVELMIHVTASSLASSQHGSSASSLNEEKSIEKNTARDTIRDISRLPRAYGRPNLRQIVSEEMLESPGSTAFVVCGPGAMNDDVRIAIAENLCQAKGRTDYFEEAFSW